MPAGAAGAVLPDSVGAAAAEAVGAVLPDSVGTAAAEAVGAVLPDSAGAVTAGGWSADEVQATSIASPRVRGHRERREAPITDVPLCASAERAVKQRTVRVQSYSLFE